MSFCWTTPTGDEKVYVVGGEAGDRPTLYFTFSSYSCAEAGGSLESTNRTSLRSLILRKKSELLSELSAVSSRGAREGMVTAEEWAAAMQSVTGLMIDWTSLLPLLEIEADRATGLIDYRQFVAQLRANSSTLGLDDTGAGTLSSHSPPQGLREPSMSSVFNAMYQHRATLEIVFNFFDLDGECMFFALSASLTSFACIR